MSRDRSRSPRRFDDWDAKAATLHLDILNSMISDLKSNIESLKANAQDKNTCIARLELQLASTQRSVKILEELIEKARIDDVIQKANIDALGDVVKAKDDCIASLDWSLALKARTSEMMHEIVNEHCRQAASR